MPTKPPPLMTDPNDLAEWDRLHKALDPLLEEHQEFLKKGKTKTAKPEDTKAAYERNKQISSLREQLQELRDKVSVVKHVLKTGTKKKN
ncbi:MAG TPA: hypothetical protein VII08_18445 [Myxococcales bacterium]